MADHSQMKLGKLPAKASAEPLLFYYAERDIPVEPSADWSHKVMAPWGVMLNDRLSCCTIAALGHGVQTWTANVSAEVTPQDVFIEGDYERICGYNPKDTATDRGGSMVDVLDAYCSLGMFGYDLNAYGVLRSGNRNDAKLAIQYFGGAYLGLELPISAQTQDVWDRVTTIDGAAGSWGGHAVWAVAYDADAVTIVTWGQLKRMTWAFVDAYCSEGFALLSRAWLTAAGVSPGGVNWPALIADVEGFAEVKKGKDMDNAIKPDAFGAGTVPIVGPVIIGGDPNVYAQGASAPAEQPHIVVTLTAQGLLVDIPNAVMKAAAAMAFVWLSNQIHGDVSSWVGHVCHIGAAGMLASLVRSVWGSNQATRALAGAQ